LDGLPATATHVVSRTPPGYLDLAVEKAAIKSTIYEHPEFARSLVR